MSLGARIWYAYHCMPLDPNTGQLPPFTQIEEEYGLSRGVLGKLVSGKQHAASPTIIEKIGEAFDVPPEFIAHERGPWPRPTIPVPPRVVKYDGQKQLNPPRVETVAPPGAGSPELPLRVYESDREAGRRGSLLRVRERLYTRYPKRSVDETIGSSEFIGAEHIDELEAFDYFDRLLGGQRFEEKHGKPRMGERTAKAGSSVHAREGEGSSLERDLAPPLPPKENEHGRKNGSAANVRKRSRKGAR